MGDEGNKGWVMDRTSCLPSKHNRLLAVIKALFGDTSKIQKGILMPPDQGVEVLMDGKVNIMPSGEGQNIGKTLHLALACAFESNEVRAPIHLTLPPGFCLKSDCRLFAGPWPYLL